MVSERSPVVNEAVRTTSYLPDEDAAAKMVNFEVSRK
jgi:hypothetical protein